MSFLLNSFWFAATGGGLTVLFEDTFTDTNGTTLDSHTPDTDVQGGGWVDGVSGTNLAKWSITSNQVEHVGLSTYGPVYADVNQADVTAEMTRIADNMRLCLNYTSKDNTWYVTKTTAGVLSIHEVTGRTSTLRASASGLGNVSGEVITAVTDGDTISASSSEGGSPSYTVAARPHKTVTNHGLAAESYSNGGTVDNFKVSA